MRILLKVSCFINEDNRLQKCKTSITYIIPHECLAVWDKMRNFAYYFYYASNSGTDS